VTNNYDRASGVTPPDPGDAWGLLIPLDGIIVCGSFLPLTPASDLLTSHGRERRPSADQFALLLWQDSLALMLSEWAGRFSWGASSCELLSTTIFPARKSLPLWEVVEPYGHRIGNATLNRFRASVVETLTSALRTAGAPRSRILRVEDALAQARAARHPNHRASEGD